MTAHIYIDTQRTIGAISPLLFGGFAEHMGRCIYGGLYDPGSPHADERGYRQDVLQALRELHLSIIRYPGGNFLSGYHWLDGVGPRDQRPRRRDLAWQSIETNQFGTNEFIEVCHLLNAQPMLGVNLGTGTIEEAAALVEYCNAPVGSHYADLRAAHGYPTPHAVPYWCLGNEMDGPWQIGHLDALDYGKKAREAAKMMRWQDPSVQLILCGSSNTKMMTYPEWDRLVLETCYDQVDYLALHYYATNYDNDLGSYLAMAAQFEEQVDTLAATLRYVKAALRSRRTLYLSWDEWNVWYKDRSGRGGWKAGPPLSEEVYNLEDALVVGQWLNVFLRKCDVLKIACIAQIVNTIAPLHATQDGLLRHTTYYPFLLASAYARGLSLDVLTQAPLYETRLFGPMPLLDVAASHDPATGAGAVFIVNRSLQEPLVTEVVWQGAAPTRVLARHELTGDDPKAFNGLAEPNRIVPRTLPGQPIEDGRLTLSLPPLSFTVLATM